MKRTIIVCLCLTALFTASAKDMRELWLSMPDSLIGYMDKSKRLALLDHVDMNTTAVLTNKLEGKTCLDTLTSNFMQVTLNNVVDLRMTLLPSTGEGATDSILCVVRTYRNAEPESVVELYDQSWKRLRKIDFDAEMFFNRPDTMSQEQYKHIRSLVSVLFVKAELREGSDVLVLTPSLPFNTREEKEKIKSIILQTNVKWNGKIFNKC